MFGDSRRSVHGELNPDRLKCIGLAFKDFVSSSIDLNPDDFFYKYDFFSFTNVEKDTINGWFSKYI